MLKKILDMLKKGMTLEQIKVALLEDEAHKDADLTEVAKHIKNAQTIIQQEADQKAADEKAARDAEVEAQKQAIIAEAKKQAEAELANTDVKSKLDPSNAVEVKEQKGVWMAETAEYIKLAIGFRKNELTSKQVTRFNELREKNYNSQAEFHMKSYGMKLENAQSKATNSGMNVTTDASGGYFIRTEFDQELDKLYYEGSELLDEIRIRPAEEDIAINGIGTFNYTYRANDDTNITKTKPTLNQDTLALKDAGAIVPISNRLLSGSYYNLVSELMEGESDAGIRLFEQQITTGDDAESDEVFDGIWFTSGISTLVAKNSGTSGAINPSDLHNLFLSCAAQTRRKGSYVMRAQEFQYLYGLKDSTGRPIGDELFNWINGKLYFKGTGKRVILVDNMEGVNGVTNKTTQTEYPVIFGDLSRFRLYRKGGRQIDMSQHVYFEYNQMAIRFILENAQTIGTNSKSSFVALTGIKENAVV